MSMSFSWHIPILYISFLNVEVGNDSVNNSARLSFKCISEHHFTTLLEFMCIKELWRNVFSFISFDITSFDLCNTAAD